MNGRSSRWDVLSGEEISSCSTASIGPRFPRRGRDSCHIGPKNNVDLRPQRYRRNSSSSLVNYGGRGRQKTCDTSNGSTDSDSKVREKIQRLKSHVSTIIDESTLINRNGGREIESMNALLEELSNSLFGISESSSIVERSCALKSSWTSIDHCHHSPDILWEAADAIIHILKQLMPSKYFLFVEKMSLIAASSLLMLHDEVQKYVNDLHTHTLFHRPSSMTDSSLCDCASILLDFLGSQHRRLDGEELSKYYCGGSLFNCVATILSISRIFRKNESSGKTSRSILFPGAERTVNLVVKQAALPFVHTILNSDDTLISHSAKLRLCFNPMNCLLILLRGDTGDSNKANAHPSKHAAAILAPLVIGVDHDGKESERTNPLRTRSLNAICLFWNCAHQTTQNESSEATEDSRLSRDLACQCLTAALNSVYSLRRDRSEKLTVSSDIDVAPIIGRIQNLLLNERSNCDHSTYLQLLASLCLAYPSAVAEQWHLFLEQSTSSNRKINPGGVGTGPLLLSFVDNGISSMKDKRFSSKAILDLPDALKTITAILSSTPFPHWIVEERRVSKDSSVGIFFSSRVRNSVLSIVFALECLMTSVRDLVSSDSADTITDSSKALIGSIVDQSAILSGKFCAILPFRDNNSILLRPVSNLLGLAGEIYISCSNRIQKNALHKKALSSFRYMILESMEPITTNTGTATRDKLLPAQHWLCQRSSFKFIEFLFYHGSPSQEQERLEILTRISRSCPWALAREPFNLASFCEICSYQYSHNERERRYFGVKLVESFYTGKKELSHECVSLDIGTATAYNFYPLLISALEDPHASIRAAAVRSFGSMLQSDWVALFNRRSCDGENETTRFKWQHLDPIFRLCLSTNEDSDELRSSACKAIGDISNICIGYERNSDFNDSTAQILTDESAIVFSRKVCNEMDNALNDGSPSVRSMGLFAIGNVSLAVKDRFDRSDTLLSLMSQLHTSFSLVTTLLNDKDEKVGSNAIRTIAHLAYFIYSSDVVSVHNLFLYTNILSNLTTKLKRAIDDAIGGPTNDLTWKQRRHAKKHAWGSCSTMGVLLTLSARLPRQDEIFIDSALLEMIRCIQYSGQLNEKITLAAVHSLVALTNSFWKHLSDDCNSLGQGLVSCCRYLCNISNQRAPLPSYHIDVQTLAATLIGCAKTRDFCILILTSDYTSQIYLYQWLVSNNVNCEIMERITAAVETVDVQQYMDVSLVQMFVSRTHQTKKMESPCKSILDTASKKDECDEL